MTQGVWYGYNRMTSRWHPAYRTYSNATVGERSHGSRGPPFEIFVDMPDMEVPRVFALLTVMGRGRYFGSRSTCHLYGSAAAARPGSNANGCNSDPAILKREIDHRIRSEQPYAEASLTLSNLWQRHYSFIFSFVSRSARRWSKTPTPHRGLRLSNLGGNYDP